MASIQTKHGNVWLSWRPIAFSVFADQLDTDFHLDTIDKDKGNYLISSRDCSAISYIFEIYGSIIWCFSGYSHVTLYNAELQLQFPDDIRFQNRSNVHGVTDILRQ